MAAWGNIAYQADQLVLILPQVTSFTLINGSLLN